MAAKTWTCRRSVGGIPCGTANAARKRKCGECGGEKPKRKRPAHMAALDVPYEEYLFLNDGKELCAICGRPPTPGRRLNRDHCHRSGNPRGLLCHNCNRWLRAFMTVEWMQKAIAYLERAEWWRSDRAPEETGTASDGHGGRGREGSTV